MSEKKSWVHSPWTVSVGSGIILFILTSIFKDKPVFSSLWSVFKWCWNLMISILNFDIKVWWLIVFVVFIVFILYVIDKYLSDKQECSTYDFRDYKQDVFFQYKWIWGWQWSSHRNAWIISDLKILCPKCDTVMDLSYMSFTCPRCNTQIMQSSCDKHKVESLILDNIRKMQEKAENKK